MPSHASVPDQFFRKVPDETALIGWPQVHLAQAAWRPDAEVAKVALASFDAWVMTADGLILWCLWTITTEPAGPPIALVCRAIEHAAAAHGLSHIARLTANLLRPVPIGEVAVEVATDYAGRNAGHFSARLVAGGKEVARFTALAQRENEL